MSERVLSISNRRLAKLGSDWRWTGWLHRTEKHHWYAVCECKCGRKENVLAVSLVSGSSKGCHDCGNIKKRTHGESATALFRTWASMRNRCRNTANAGYRYYGGRGISVCEEWDDFRVFRDWALANGYQPGLSIERIDVNGPYSPSNCAWIPPSQQSCNRRFNNRISFRGETLIESEWCRRLGVTPGTIARRIRNGWPLEVAITQPPQRETTSG